MESSRIPLNLAPQQLSNRHDNTYLLPTLYCHLMAEIAAIGLVASLATLVDLTARLISRVRDFTSQTSDVPEAFRDLADRLPLLRRSIQHIDAEAKSDRVTVDTAKDLQQIVENVNKEAEFLWQRLGQMVPSNGASRWERVRKSLQSLMREEKLQQAVSRIHQSIDVLVLYQTTNTKESIDELRRKLPSLHLHNPLQQQLSGLRLGLAPQISPDAFIGRKEEIQQLHDWLASDTATQGQKIVSIVGIGGLGKTQLSLAYARQKGDNFSFVFWLDAKDQLTLQKSMVVLAKSVLRNPELGQNSNEEKAQVEIVRHWLAEAWNNQWLLIFDNYDDPSLPNIRSPTGFDIRPFFPSCGHGSILITTRSPKLHFSRLLKLQNLKHLDDSLGILSQRSGRDITYDVNAGALAKRLDGLPLALATAGTFMGQTGMSCDEYLEAHNSAWADLYGDDSEQLLEYPDRVLSSTWTISYQKLQQHDADAAKLLTFFAYFDNQDIWFELLQACESDQLPWIQRVVKNRLQFGRTMSKIHDYSLIEVVPGTSSSSYSLHKCFHDWIFETFNNPPQESWMLAASYGVVGNQLGSDHPQYWTMARRLLKHAQWLSDERFKSLWQACRSNKIAIQASCSLAEVLSDWHLFTSAEQMYWGALVGLEKTLGKDDPLTLTTIHNLGLLYQNQGRLNEAGQMYNRALVGDEKARVKDNPLTLTTINNLGLIYQDQGRLGEAEQMFQRTLVGQEEALGKDHPSTLTTVHNLGSLYQDQGRLGEAEQMFQRTLIGEEKALGKDHPSTLTTVHNLGLLYRDQGRLGEAEQMFQRTLIGEEKALGKDHPSMLTTVHNLGSLYQDQGRLDEAEHIYNRALVGKERALGRDHPSTLTTVHNLGRLYQDQDRLDEAEQMYNRELVGQEKALGKDHPLTQGVAKVLIEVSIKQSKIKEAKHLLEQFPDSEHPIDVDPSEDEVGVSGESGSRTRSVVPEVAEGCDDNIVPCS